MKPQAAPQQRKKRVLEEVLKQRRRQKTITLAIIGAILVAIIAGGAYVLANQRPSNLPPYLAVCVSGYGNAYHAHAHLSITIDGGARDIPQGTGINSGCLRPLHVHSADNMIHIEPDTERDFKLSDFFLIWGKEFNSTTRQFMGVNYLPGKLTMTVTGLNNTDFENYVFPRNAQYGQDTCSQKTPTGQPDCITVDISIKVFST